MSLYDPNELHNTTTYTLFIDLRKAFDTVAHFVLIKKALHLWNKKDNLLKNALELCATYLKIRIQFVVYDGDTESFDCVVPPVSSLGPLFFIAYMNDIFYCFTVLLLTSHLLVGV